VNASTKADSHSLARSLVHSLIRSLIHSPSHTKSMPFTHTGARLKALTHAQAIKSVKCTLVQALRLCTDRTDHRGSRGIALLCHDHGTRRGWGVSVTPRPLFTPGKDPVPIVQEAEWAPGPVWTGAENLAPTGIRSPDYAIRPTHRP
jgi:hypothetical protein